ncbi:hypothetical protein R3P38DRAFT_3189056 [Favolaschia claudopus]|uniref:Uncharacterized protein n=1 Tax=Favolaschia claudopus TaxID=2862362 RepID=A0AAW0BTJ1_9AGAR
MGNHRHHHVSDVTAPCTPTLSFHRSTTLTRPPVGQQVFRLDFAGMRMRRKERFDEWAWDRDVECATWTVEWMDCDEVEADNRVGGVDERRWETSCLPRHRSHTRLSRPQLPPSRFSSRPNSIHLPRQAGRAWSSRSLPTHAESTGPDPLILNHGSELMSPSRYAFDPTSP